MHPCYVFRVELGGTVAGTECSREGKVGDKVGTLWTFVTNFQCDQLRRTNLVAYLGADQMG